MSDEITPLTDDQIDAILKQWQESGEKRLRNFGSKFSEEDYIAGAMAVLFALKSQDKMPASWASFGVSDNSHFRKEKSQKEARERMIRMMDYGSALLTDLKGMVALSHDLEYRQTRGETRQDLIQTIQLVDPGWTPYVEEEEDDDEN